MCVVQLLKDMNRDKDLMLMLGLNNRCNGRFDYCGQCELVWSGVEVGGLTCIDLRRAILAEVEGQRNGEAEKTMMR